MKKDELPLKYWQERIPPPADDLKKYNDQLLIRLDTTINSTKLNVQLFLHIFWDTTTEAYICESIDETRLTELKPKRMVLNSTLYLGMVVLLREKMGIYKISNIYSAPDSEGRSSVDTINTTLQ